MRLRAAESGDLATVQAIYAHHVLHGLGTFEETPRTWAVAHTQPRSTSDRARIEKAASMARP